MFNLTSGHSNQFDYGTESSNDGEKTRCDIEVTLKALANASPGLLRPFDLLPKNLNAESVE